MNNLLIEIPETWKLEAKQEEQGRFFYNIPQAEEMLLGKKYYLIGRKGSGKSAISEYLLSIKKHNVFSVKLSFKNFPFNQIYNLVNGDYTYPNQYISIWKYIIYSKVCSLMVANNNIDTDIRNSLRKLYPETDENSLSRMIKQWVSSGFGISLVGFKISGNRDRKESDFSHLNWIDKSDYLEDLIKKYIDNSFYYIIFDELDEDYRDFVSQEDREKYKSLLTSLFKAVQDIRGLMKNKNNIFPLVFLRDDIYALITDADKNKWSDFKINLDWNEDEIKKLIAHRISMSIGFDKNLNFIDAWGTIFSSQKVRMGTRQQKEKDSFSYITMSSQLRPRDYIKYICECCKESNKKFDKIHPRVVKLVDKTFSNYLKDEIKDEIYPILPDIDGVFSIISQIRKWNFSIQEFKENYLSSLKDEIVKENDIDFILKTLFDFSVIGNSPVKRSNIQFFRYKNVEARFNFKENIVVHRGLFKALQIL